MVHIKIQAAAIAIYPLAVGGALDSFVNVFFALAVPEQAAVQAFFLVADDVMDELQTRRGQPCWYKKPNVHMIAINDSFLLKSFVFTILRKHFGHEPYYLRLIELFISVI